MSMGRELCGDRRCSAEGIGCKLQRGVRMERKVESDRSWRLGRWRMGLSWRRGEMRGQRGWRALGTGKCVIRGAGTY